MLSKEEWRPVVDADVGYEVSNWGRVRSWKNRTGFGKDIWLDTPAMLRYKFHYKGYVYVKLRKNGMNKKFFVHRLVAKAFIPNPDNLPEVNHENGNKEDCSIHNLYWTTRPGNMEHARRTGLWDPEESLKRALEKWRTPIYCYEKDCVYSSGEDAARDIGVSKSLITHVCQGKTHNAKGFHLCYEEEKDWFLRNIEKIKLIEGQKKRVKAINVNSGEERIYNSRQDASKDLRIPDSYISNIIAGRSYQTRGWTFKDAPIETIERRSGDGGHKRVSGL